MTKAKLLTIGTTLWFLSCSLLVAGEIKNSTDTVAVEEYTPEIIIEAKWGKEPGEFGICTWGYGLALPRAILVKEDMIYILDSANARINRYTKTGKFLGEITLQKEIEKSLCGKAEKSKIYLPPFLSKDISLGGFEDFFVDKKGTIYLNLGLESPGAILVYGPTGKLLGRICRKELDNAYLSYLFYEKNERVYFKTIAYMPWDMDEPNEEKRLKTKRVYRIVVGKSSVKTVKMDLHAEKLIHRDTVFEVSRGKRPDFLLCSFTGASEILEEVLGNSTGKIFVRQNGEIYETVIDDYFYRGIYGSGIDLFEVNYKLLSERKFWLIKWAKVRSRGHRSQ